MDWGNAVVVQRDGKIVVAGQTSYPKQGRAFVLVRYRPDGALDGKFGARGKVITAFKGDSVALDVAQTSGGRILVVGGGLETRKEWLLARYSRASIAPSERRADFA